MNRDKKKKQFIFVDDPEAVEIRKKEEKKDKEKVGENIFKIGARTPQRDCRSNPVIYAFRPVL